MLNKIQKLVISRSDNLGDVMLTLPLAGFLKTHYPHLNIGFIGKAYTRALINACQHIDYFLDREKLLKGEDLERLSSAEAILFVFPDQDLAKLSQQLNIRYRIGTSHRWFHWRYLNYRVNFSRKKNDLHEAQLNFKLLRPLGIEVLPSLAEMPNYYGFAPSGNLKEELHAELQASSEFKLIIHPKSKGSAREWSLAHYLELVQAEQSENIRFYLTGTEQEGKIIEQQCPELLQQTNVYNLTGKLSLEALVLFIAQVDGLLACSTGPLHIAAALGKYALGIYPPMRPIHPGRWRPLGQNAQVLVLDKNCNDCRKGGTCQCIEAISVAQVQQHLQSFIAST